MMKKKLFVMLALLISIFSFSQNSGFILKNRFSDDTGANGGPKLIGEDVEFISPESLLQSFYESEVFKKKNQIKAEKSALKSYIDSIRAETTQPNQQPNPISKEERIIKRLNESKSKILKIQNDVSKIEKKVDSLELLHSKSELLEVNNHYFLNSRKARAFFDLLYEGEGKVLKGVNNTGFFIGDKTGSIYSELLSGNFGFVRVGLGSVVSNNSSSEQEDEDDTGTQDEAYQRFVTYGGNTVLTIEHPTLYLHTNRHNMNLIGRTLIKGMADLPAFGTDTEEIAGSGLFGFYLYGDAALDNNVLRFFFDTNINYVVSSNEFRDNLGIKENNFVFGQLTAGLVLFENFKISFILQTFSSEPGLRNRNVIGGGQVVR